MNTMAVEVPCSVKEANELCKIKIRKYLQLRDSYYNLWQHLIFVTSFMVIMCIAAVL